MEKIPKSPPSSPPPQKKEEIQQEDEFDIQGDVFDGLDNGPAFSGGNSAPIIAPPTDAPKK